MIRAEALPHKCCEGASECSKAAAAHLQRLRHLRPLTNERLYFMRTHYKRFRTKTLNRNRDPIIRPIRISLFAAMQLILVSCAAGSVPVFAFLTWTASSGDVISAGHNSIEIIESGSFPEAVHPGTPVSSANTVSVRNTGTVPCYVRLKVIISNDSLAGHITLDGTNTAAWNASHAGSDVYDPEADSRLYGYYYFTEPLEPDSVSPPLLTGISIDSGTDEEMLMNYSIALYAESIQKGSYGSWEEAWEDF